MTYKAVFLGSVGVLAETSEIQRKAYNLAFQDAGLDWVWEDPFYYALLRKPGGLDRVIAYAAQRNVAVDAKAIHASKVRHFRKLALQDGLNLRPGVAELVQAAKDGGVSLGLVTTTTPGTLELIFDALGSQLRRRIFDIVIDRTDVVTGKPAPNCYKLTLNQLQVAADDCLAVEDTPESQTSATLAGITCIAFPGYAATGRVFDANQPVVQTLSPDLLIQRRASA